MSLFVLAWTDVDFYSLDFFGRINEKSFELLLFIKKTRHESKKYTNKVFLNFNFMFDLHISAKLDHKQFFKVVDSFDRGPRVLSSDLWIIKKQFEIIL